MKGIKLLSLVVFVSTLFSSCVKQQFDVPPSNCDSLNQLQPNLTIKQLKDSIPANTDTFRITKDWIIAGYVISNDQYGNFYKELVIQDSTAGISILIDQYSLFTIYPPGQKVIVKCKDLYLGRQYGVIKLGSTYDDNGVIRFGRIQGPEVIDMHIIKTCENVPQQPIEITIPDINDQLLYRYVKLNPVQFVETELGTTWANPYADPPQAVNHTLVDPNGNTIIVRTSGYATFAGELIPEGSGEFVAILGKYNTDYQLYINSPNEVKLDQERFALPFFLSKNFDDGSITSGGWIVKTYAGDGWVIGTYGGRIFAKASNYTSAGAVNFESWLISPELDFTQVTGDLILNFQTASFDGSPRMSVKISDNYAGDPQTATWTDLLAQLSPGGWTWTSSGDINLNAYKGKVVRIAFVYEATTADDNTWELDDIIIKEVR